MSRLKKKRVCVIGAGPSGLPCIKSCIEEGLDVVCYERSDSLGGLWKYREEVSTEWTSVARSTVANTCRELCSYSDFPVDPHFPNYMHNSYMYRYFKSYADKFQLEQYIEYHTKVTKVTYSRDYETNGRMDVSIERDGYISIEVFDSVLICTGHHVYPYEARFPGRDLFQGLTLHTHSYKKPEAFVGKRVVVVGIGSSGGDAAVEIADTAQTTYLSTRRGCWIKSRIGLWGFPKETHLATRLARLVMSYIPRGLLNNILEFSINQGMDHEMYGLKPNHRISEQHLVINDLIPSKIISGALKVKPNIERFTENGVIFEGEKHVTPIDAVVFATGYQNVVPFVDPSIISVAGDNLFMNCFNLKLKHKTSICLIGMIQVMGPIHTTSEMQARYCAALISGRVKLPDQKEINRVTNLWTKYRASFYMSPRHHLEANYQVVMDTMASYLGVKPNLYLMAITDPVLYYHIMTGIFTAFQFRLKGPHSWSGARDMIIHQRERTIQGFKSIE